MNAHNGTSEEMDATNGSGADVSKWGRIEITFESSNVYKNPIQEVALQVIFTSPSGAAHHVMGFWDGSTRFRARFSPEEEGKWTYATFCSDVDNGGLHNREGDFVCGPPNNLTPFDMHGHVRVSADRNHFEHADGRPFFWLADTAWNGCLLSSKDEWRYYLSERVRQGFTAVQWVATPWRSAPADRDGQKAFEGVEKIQINPKFFQRMDEWIEMTYDVGLLNAPVMLWTHKGGDHPEMNPGVGLPDDQLILLAEYMVARWACYPVVWILGGDGKYEGADAERWRSIGEAVFGRGMHAPVAMHVVGQSFPVEEFRTEGWMDVLGYQSGHGDSEKTLKWIVSGPPAEDWKKSPRQFYINLEPAYENHVAYHSKKPHDAASVRMAIYWSLLNAPTAGVTYGGHGVWGWDDGSGPPMDHPNTGTPLPWREGLFMDAAEQMRFLRDSFETIDWWRLYPAPELLVTQPGDEDVHDHILVSKSDANDLVVAYTPQGKPVQVDMRALPDRLSAIWYNPRTGDPEAATPVVEGDSRTYNSPDEEDWLLVLA